MTRQYHSESINPRQVAIELIAAFVAATLALLAVISFRGVTILVIRWYLLALGAFAILALYRVIAGSSPLRGRSAFDRALEPTTLDTDRPERLQDIERHVYLAHIDSSEFHYRLAPLLREIASYRLASHRSVPAEQVPTAARALLDRHIYDLLWPGEDKPTDRREAGIKVNDVKAILQAVEEL